jgi:hypothetical protein
MKLRRPSPALVVALVALFMSLSGTAVAAGVVPLAKQALFAKNAGKLQGKSARQIAAMPGPASSATYLVGQNGEGFALAPGEEKEFTARCPETTKAISGGYKTRDNAPVLATASHRGELEHWWTFRLMNPSDSTSVTGFMSVLCLF